MCVSVALLLLGCRETGIRNKRNLSFESFAEMKVDEYALNSLLIRENLEHICREDRDSNYMSSKVRNYYREGGRLLWIDPIGVDSRGDTLLDVLSKKLPAMGFNSHVFRIGQISQDLERMRTLDFDDTNTINKVAARLEYNLTSAYMRYVAGQRFGFVNPSYVLNHYEALEVDTTGQVKSYRQLFDVDMEHADKTFLRTAVQWITPDSLGSHLRQVETKGELYARLQQILSTASGNQRQRIIVNMERCRWREKLQPEPGQKYVIVNVSAYHLWAVSPDTVIEMRAACGAKRTKTPLLSSRITHMEVNPQWVIPMSIISNDIARHAGDSSYFARHRYYIAERKTGKHLSPKAVTSGMLLSGKYRVAQEGGEGNSLGRIIFRFPNNFSVFLHDTSSPGVFQRDNRGVSHGCVRVQHPFDLAVFMMENDPDPELLDKLRISMGMTPETDWGRDQLDQLDPAVKTPQLVRSINVTPRVPIIITYYTMFQTPDGSLQTYPDVYGYDGALGEALKPYIQND